jgi:dTDP-4-amino-4,6-dideoxygalactose transaminase
MDVSVLYLMGEEEIEAVKRVLESRQLFRYRGGEGGETDHFEEELAAKIGAPHSVAVTSGTAAIICGLAGMQIGPGDEVIVPAYTFMATALAPLAVGAVPIIAEVDESLTLDPNDLEGKISPRTKAVIPVHMMGLPCNMEAIGRITADHGIGMLEDCCQAVGGSYGGYRLGSLGDVGAFSFNQFKIITCGEGGALTTAKDEIYERALMYHDGGCVFREHAEAMGIPFFAGSNFRMNEILGAILRVQLGRLDGILEALRREKAVMVEELADEEAFDLSPRNDPKGDCGTTLALLFASPARSRAFIAKLAERGIGSSTPIDSGRHVYENWDPIMNKRGAHHPGYDAFRLTDSPPHYSRDMCPGTLSALRRTVYIATSPTRSPDETTDLIEGIRQAGRENSNP